MTRALLVALALAAAPAHAQYCADDKEPRITRIRDNWRRTLAAGEVHKLFRVGLERTPAYEVLYQPVVSFPLARRLRNREIVWVSAWAILRSVEGYGPEVEIALFAADGTADPRRMTAAELQAGAAEGAYLNFDVLDESPYELWLDEAIVPLQAAVDRGAARFSLALTSTAIDSDTSHWATIKRLELEVWHCARPKAPPVQSSLQRLLGVFER